ncbi:MAG: hypothetical protein JW925_10865 [Syntrophaceae bacterium]|nr:hypothetical protein [Syntrophaceae bacterium]
MSIKITLIDEIEQNKENLKAVWGEFPPEAIPAGLSLDHLFDWWERYGRIENHRIGYKKRPIILIIHRGEKLVGILPLMKVERFKNRVLRVATLEFLTQSFGGDYLDMIHNGMAIEEIARTFKLIKKQFKYDLIHLCYLKENSLLLQAGLGAVGLHSGKIIIPLDRSYKQIRNEVYSKNLRHVLNKFRRRISESSEKIQSLVIEGGENILKIKDNIKKVSLSKLADLGMHSLYQDTKIGESYFNAIVSQEKPFCSVYLAGDELLSYNIGNVQNGVVCAFDAAYNRCYAESQKIGLGILAYDSLVEKYAEKYRELDMGFGLDDYKFRFSKQVIFTHSLLVKGNTFKAGILFKHRSEKQKQIAQTIRLKTEGRTND